MKTNNIYILFVITILIVSCKCDCPDSYLFDKNEIPYWLMKNIDLYDVDSMTFLNDSGDTLNFKKDYNSRDETSRTLIKNATCKEDRTEVVDIYYDRTWNRVFFVSDNNDSLGFQYYTQLASLGSFSYKNYDIVNDDEPYDMFVNYMNVMFKIDGLDYSLTALILDREPTVFQKKLSGGYNVLGISYDDVYYREHPVIPVNVYFNNEVGIVGMEDLYGVKWIRLL